LFGEPFSLFVKNIFTTINLNIILIKSSKMKKQKEKLFQKEDAKQVSENNTDGYPLYPPGEDIYNNAIEETELDPEDPSKLKTPNEEPDEMNEKNLYDMLTGDDLDVPGSELDATQEAAGSEDEENNYYSLGDD